MLVNPADVCLAAGLLAHRLAMNATLIPRSSKSPFPTVWTMPNRSKRTFFNASHVSPVARPPKWVRATNSLSPCVRIIYNNRVFLLGAGAGARFGC